MCESEFGRENDCGRVSVGESECGREWESECGRESVGERVWERE